MFLYFFFLFVLLLFYTRFYYRERSSILPIRTAFLLSPSPSSLSSLVLLISGTAPWRENKRSPVNLTPQSSTITHYHITITYVFHHGNPPGKTLGYLREVQPRLTRSLWHIRTWTQYPAESHKNLDSVPRLESRRRKISSPDCYGLSPS